MTPLISVTATAPTAPTSTRQMVPSVHGECALCVCVCVLTVCVCAWLVGVAAVQLICLRTLNMLS